MHIVFLYASLLALLYLVLTFRTIFARGKYHVTLGDGGHQMLQRAIRAHANFSEYVPFALVLLFLVALSGANAITVHVIGVALLIGRLLHALGVSRLREPLALRMAGMVLTTGCIFVCAVILLVTFWGSIGSIQGT